MKIRHYIRGDTVGTGPYRFRHFQEEPSRFAQFVNGTLEEIREEDFEDVTVFDTTCISCYGGYVGEITGGVSLPYLKIYMPNTITTLLQASPGSLSNYGYFSFAPLQYIKFSAQLTDFSDNTICVSAYVDGGYVADFSEHIIIPSLCTDSTNNFNKNAVIQVPSSLLSSWTSAWSGYINSSATIVGV